MGSGAELINDNQGTFLPQLLQPNPHHLPQPTPQNIDSPCRLLYFGIDFPSRDELIAAQHETDKIREFIGADSLAYISTEGLLSAFDNPGDYCAGCFTGKYPADIAENHTKKALEKAEPIEV